MRLSDAARGRVDQIGRAVDNHANAAAPRLPQPYNDFNELARMDAAQLDAHEDRIGPPAMNRLVEKVGAKNKADVPRAVREKGKSEYSRLVKAVAAARQAILFAKARGDVQAERRA